MNNKIIYCVTSMAVGAVIGGFTAWILTKNKYESEMKEKIDSEVNSVKDSLTKYYENKKEEKSEKVPFVHNGYTYKHADARNVDIDKINEKMNNEKMNEELMSDYVYENEEDDEDMTPINNPDVLNEYPYAIPPEEFGDYVDYEPTTLYYYADGVLADEDDNVVEDPVAMVGDDFMDHYGEYEDDCVYVRNDRYRRDYEILRSEKTFAEQQAQKYSDVVNSPYLEDEE